MATTASPFDVEDVRARVSRALTEYVDAQVPILEAISLDLSPLNDSSRSPRAASDFARSSPGGVGEAPVAVTTTG